MTQRTRKKKKSARQSAERVAYAAVGAPTAALRAVRSRLDDLRETVRSSREGINEELSEEIDEWIAQGEEVIERAMRRVRDSGVADKVRSSAQSTRDAARVGVDKAAEAAKSGLDVIEPEEDLTTITGIGPSFADKLRKAGVVGISAFLDRTRTDEGIADLAVMSGVSRDTIESWRARADLSRVEGIGESHRRLLHRVGVWTLEQLADVDPTELADHMRAVDLPDVPDRIPSETLIAQWKTEAAKLD